LTNLEHAFNFLPKRNAGKASVGVAAQPGASACSTGRREESKDVAKKCQGEEATRHVKHCTRRKVKLFKGL
jgi:hypothetical protein